MTSAPFPGPPSDSSYTGQQPPAATGPTMRPRLRRSASDRMIGGVCGGLADYSGIDSVLWRVGFVALTLAGGSGILVYLILWVLTPSDPLPADTTPSPLERVVERLHRALSGAVTSARRD